MENKLTTEQSLDLIARMISDTRRNFNDRGGAMFLIWGYTTIAVTIAVTVIFYLTRNYTTMWLWWAIPVVCGILTWLHYRKHQQAVTTLLDKAVSYVWIAFTVACMSCVVFGFATSAIDEKSMIDILFTIALLIGMATATTGLIIKFRPVAIGGFVGIVASLALPFFNGTMWQFPIFAAIFLIAQVIPGHLLNAACRREARKARETRVEKNGRAA
jgi:hypothetical protein